MGHTYVPSSEFSDLIWEKLEHLWSTQNTDFIPLSTRIPMVSGRPLLVLVHPGDSTQEPEDSGQDIAEASFGLQRCMADEIMSMAEDHDLVVLHRQSSHYGLADATNVSHALIEVIETIHDRGITMYGDDLDAASLCLINHLNAQERPAVFLTGAWSDPKYGCVTAIGKALQAAGATVQVSRWSPSEPGSTQDQWHPEHVPAT